MQSAAPLSNSSAESMENLEDWGSEGQTPSTGSEDLAWIEWHCSLPGHEYFCEVVDDYIEDDFNMTGLSSVVPMYKEALEFILDLEPDEDEFELDAAERRVVESSAELLYGLVHQRFITTRMGLNVMAEKYEAGHFGSCPRVLCAGTGVLPVGLSDVVGEEPVKLYCPNCLDVYHPPHTRFSTIDGAYFGTTFPHLFFLTFPELLPHVAEDIYEPRIFGFRVSERSRTGPRMRWLRSHIGDDLEDDTGSMSSDNGDANPPAGSDHDEAMPDHVASTKDLGDTTNDQAKQKRPDGGPTTQSRTTAASHAHANHTVYKAVLAHHETPLVALAA